MAGHWKRLPREVVTAPSLPEYKKHLDNVVWPLVCPAQGQDWSCWVPSKWGYSTILQFLVWIFFCLFFRLVFFFFFLQQLVSMTSSNTSSFCRDAHVTSYRVSTTPPLFSKVSCQSSFFVSLGVPTVAQVDWQGVTSAKQATISHESAKCVVPGTS